MPDSPKRAGRGTVNRRGWGVTRTLIVASAVTATALAGPPEGGAGVSGPASPTVWLCRPGLASDPCLFPLTTTVLGADGSTSVLRPRDARRPPIDCFYLYPTVSLEPTANADLAIQPAETGVAVDQASRFSQVCRVFAPMYRQLTLAAITGRAPPDEADVELAYDSALAAFKDYLAKDNDGRGIVFIGHSQGAGILIHLLQQEVDPNPALRRRLVSAILLGGNVAVPVGRPVGGTFTHIPACRAADQLGCVVAYSSFLSPPPAHTIFGRVGQGVNAVPGQNPAGLQVLCVNPAALRGGAAPLQSYFLAGSGPRIGEVGAEPTLSTPWVTYPDRYRGRCQSAGGATWLDITPATDDPRPVLSQVLGPAWGLHLADVNLTLGNLVTLVGAEARAYAARSR
jgi:hypothetical protein